MELIFPHLRKLRRIKEEREKLKDDFAKEFGIPPYEKEDKLEDE